MSREELRQACNENLINAFFQDLGVDERVSVSLSCVEELGAGAEELICCILALLDEARAKCEWTNSVRLELKSDERAVTF